MTEKRRGNDKKETGMTKKKEARMINKHEVGVASSHGLDPLA
ncbi:MAG: hypothetical protein SFT93_02105 [Rickettsiaceae bacterium]|nr:hypothetical protein [Rickettsiaceae bacterium]